MPKYTLALPKESPLHQRICKKIEARMNLSIQEQQKRHDKWQEAEERTLAYVPENELDAARTRKRDAGEPKYTTIQIPYSFAVLMSAHTYWTSVFFARSPIHQFSGRHGEGEMQIQAMEALISYQVDVGQMMVPYYIWLYDSGKYGHGVLCSYWDRQKLRYGSLVEMDDPASGRPALWQATQEIEGYQGNSVFNVSPWDFYNDPRKSLKEFQKGEFCARRIRMSWNDTLRRQDLGYFNKNIDSLKDHHATERSSGVMSTVLERPAFDKLLIGDNEKDDKHPAGWIGFEFYVELVPREWGLGKGSYPEKWCFSITEDFRLIVGASPMGYVHCQYPFDVLESEIEGYGSFTRGIPEIMEPVQNTVDWLVNTHFFNVRASLNNQFLVDPSKIVIKDAQNSGPGFIWRLRPEAYGTDLAKMFMQIPVQDVTRAHMADFQAMLGVGERTLGINDQIMGSLNTGSARKTATEVRTTTGFGVNRQKTICEFMSAQGFGPHAQKLVQNSQQFYSAEQKFRRVGSFIYDAGEAFMSVSPADIVGFFDLVPVDGMMPIDRMAQTNLWKELMAGIRMMPPQVAMSYDWAKIFGWVAMLGGLRNINQFKVQVLPPGVAPAGNVVPLRGVQPALPAPAAEGRSPVSFGNSASTAAGLDSYGAQE